MTRVLKLAVRTDRAATGSIPGEGAVRSFPGLG
jgi:hypothetical protein